MIIYNEKDNVLYEKFLQNKPKDFIKTINRHFKIKVFGLGFNILLGVRGLVSLVGVDNASNLLEGALRSDKDIIRCRLRRGLSITFYSK